MKLFRYLSSTKDIKETYKIYKVVRDLKPYAISKYKSSWEDALDEAFFHILENYDSEKGDLEHYATRIVGTILLNKDKKEVANDEQTKLGLDLKVASEYKSSTLELIFEDEKSQDIKECIQDMSKLFANDLKFFISNNAKDRCMNYSKLFEKYSVKVISESKKYLVDTYFEDVKNFIEAGKGSSIRNFPGDRYLKSLDEGVEYIGELNDIVIIKRKQGSHMKNAYRVYIPDLLDMFHKLFYDDDGILTIDFENTKIFLTLSGRFVDSVEKLNECLERELVGSLLSRTSLKVFHYEKGNELLLSGTKDIQFSIILNIFGKNVSVDFNKAVVKEVK